LSLSSCSRKVRLGIVFEEPTRYRVSSGIALNFRFPSYRALNGIIRNESIASLGGRENQRENVRASGSAKTQWTLLNSGCLEPNFTDPRLQPFEQG
jgi:hypothetical protein